LKILRQHLTCKDFCPFVSCYDISHIPHRYHMREFFLGPIIEEQPVNPRTTFNATLHCRPLRHSRIGVNPGCAPYPASYLELKIEALRFAIRRSGPRSNVRIHSNFRKRRHVLLRWKILQQQARIVSRLCYRPQAILGAKVLQSYGCGNTRSTRRFCRENQSAIRQIRKDNGL
jgi:hypothetical protein